MAVPTIMKPLFFKDRYIRTAAIFTAILFGASLVLALSLYNSEGVLIMHFTGPRNPDFFGSPGNLLEVLGAAFIVVLVNFLLSYFFYDRERFFAYILTFFSLFIGTLLLITVGVILSVN